MTAWEARDLILTWNTWFSPSQGSKNPHPKRQSLTAKKDSVANKMNPGAERWKDGRDFCRPAVQKTKLLDVCPYPFSDPWPKVSVRQWLGASCHKGQAPFSAHTFWSIAFIQTPYPSCSRLSRKFPTADSVPVLVPSGDTWPVWFSGRTWLECCKDAVQFSHNYF